MKFEMDPNTAEIIELAMREDLGDLGDVTSLSLIEPEREARAIIYARHDCVLAGNPVGIAVFHKVDPELKVTELKCDGDCVSKGDGVMEVRGKAISILTAERTALNFMQRLTGAASAAACFTEKTKKYGTMILDTRKTTPGYRLLEKYAVQCGGGSNHRMGLYDRVLIKDNHRKLWAERGLGDLGEAVAESRRKYPQLMVEIEVESIEELSQVLEVRPEWVMLDNMSPEDMSACVELCNGRCKTEASGGITLENVEAAAAAGVDAISLGCLTHSVIAADLSLEMEC